MTHRRGGDAWLVAEEKEKEKERRRRGDGQENDSNQYKGGWLGIGSEEVRVG